MYLEINKYQKRKGNGIEQANQRRKPEVTKKDVQLHKEKQDEFQLLRPLQLKNRQKTV